MTVRMVKKCIEQIINVSKIYLFFIYKVSLCSGFWLAGSHCDVNEYPLPSVLENRDYLHPGYSSVSTYAGYKS